MMEWNGTRNHWRIQDSTLRSLLYISSTLCEGRFELTVELTFFDSLPCIHKLRMPKQSENVNYLFQMCRTNYIYVPDLDTGYVQDLDEVHVLSLSILALIRSFG